MISRAPGLKLVVQTLLSSLRPIGNIVLICCTFFIIFGILGVQVSLVLPREWNLLFESAATDRKYQSIAFDFVATRHVLQVFLKVEGSHRKK